VIARIADLSRIVDEPDDPDWFLIQHYFGLTAFGINAYVAREAGQSLIGEHDEAGSDQEEVYVVTAGRARFTIDGVEHESTRVTSSRSPTRRRDAPRSRSRRARRSSPSAARSATDSSSRGRATTSTVSPRRGRNDRRQPP